MVPGLWKQPQHIMRPALGRCHQAQLSFIFSLRDALLCFSIAFKSYNPPAVAGGQHWFLAEEEGRVSCGLERAACCLQVGKFVGVISFCCKSGGGYSCS